MPFFFNKYVIYWFCRVVTSFFFNNIFHYFMYRVTPIFPTFINRYYIEVFFFETPIALKLQYLNNFFPMIYFLFALFYLFDFHILLVYNYFFTSILIFFPDTVSISILEFIFFNNGIQEFLVLHCISVPNCTHN